jgi:hypothetical protein
MRRLKNIGELIKAALPYKSRPQQVYELFEHKFRINTSFRDYYRFGFYKSDESWTEKSMYLGPHGSRYWPFEGNSLRYDRLFVIKSMQKCILMGAGLPTPRLLLKVGAEYPVNSLEKFREALEQIDIPVVTKFDGGGGGGNIYALERNATGFAYDGEPVDADWIWEKYQGQIERGFIVEERIENHPVLGALHPNSINTLRLNVVKTADRKWHFLKPLLRIGRGGAHVDNMSARGVFAALDENGVARIGYCKYDDNEYAVHPDTGMQIEGLQVPFFKEALELVVYGSKTFGFMQTLGWDIAVTANGPMVIEVNTGWNFESLQQRLGPLLTPEIAAGLTPRAWFTPWDKTHMYPNYLRKYRGGWWQRLMAARRRYWTERLRARADTSGT